MVEKHPLVQDKSGPKEPSMTAVDKLSPCHSLLLESIVANHHDAASHPIPPQKPDSPIWQSHNLTSVGHPSMHQVARSTAQVTRLLLFHPTNNEALGAMTTAKWLVVICRAAICGANLILSSDAVNSSD